MNLPNPPGPLTWAGWLTAALAAIAAVWFVVWLLGAPGREAATAAKARADSAYADANRKSAAAAAKKTDDFVKGSDAIDRRTKEAVDAINRACPGPDCDRATYCGLCDSAAYRDSAFCVQLACRADAAGADAGR